MDISNGPGWRVSLFVSGCRNQCSGCFNKDAWDFEYGKKFSWDIIHEIERLVSNPNIRGLSILGGEPLEPENISSVEALCAYIKEKFPEKDIWLWTGYDFIEDGLIKHSIMRYIDVLVDGRFEEDKKDLTLKYRGSSNQRIIDVSKSLEHGCAIMWDYENSH
jgi:anaerobic ribonucleoside-triphosphate reductase activating protein